MILLYTLTGHSNRDAQERFQHSGSSISRYIHEAVAAVGKLQEIYMKLPSVTTIASQIVNNPKYFPYFKDCLGALDGTHIHATVPAAEQAPFRNRKGNLSQNVLAVCNFDMQFTYCLCGWEGSAHDGRVLADAFTKGFTVPTGKYYLGDAGYGLSDKVLTPYRGTRYHLCEWKQGRKRPQNAKELFSLRHAQLRNVI